MNPRSKAYGTTEAAGHLRTCIRRPLLPGKATEQAIDKGDGRVEVATGTPCTVHPQHNPQTPAGIPVSPKTNVSQKGSSPPRY
jgi:hypothetical protein